MSWEDFGTDSKDFARDMWPHLRRVFRAYIHWGDFIHAHANLWVDACGWPLNDIRQAADQEALVIAVLKARHNPGYYFGHWLSILIPLLVIVAAVGWLMYWRALGVIDALGGGPVG